MSDHVSLVENIRAFVARSDQANSPALAELAERCSALGRATNERLLKCSDFLRRGLRSEAIHLAEAEPKLLEVVAVLDFPEFAQWEEVCTLYGLPAPQAMMMEAAAQLNEAYTAELPIQGLLKKHRLLALGLAPLQERIGVLRQIVTADPATPSWADDLKVYEGQRVRQISAEAREAQERGDLGTLTAFHAELSGPWSAEAARALKQQVGAAVAQMREKGVASDLRKLVPQIHDAHSAMDLGQVEAHLAEWARLGQSVPGGVPQKLADEVADAVAWSKAERARQLQAMQYDAARLALEEAIEKDAPDDELAAMRAEAIRLGESLPPVLEQRYQSVREARRTLTQSRRRRNTILMAAAALVVSGVSIWMVNSTLQDREAASWATAIRGDLQSKQIEQASARLAEVTKTKPKLLTRPVLAQANQELEAVLAKDRQRAEAFAAAASKAEGESADAASEKALDLSEVSRLARTPEEKSRAEELVRRVNAAQQAKQRERDEAFADGVQALQTKLVNLSALSPETDRESYERTLVDLEREARALSERPRVSSVIVATLQPSKDRLARLRTELAAITARDQDRQKEAVLLEAVVSASSVQVLKDRLDRFVTAAGESPRTVEFKRAMQSVPQWEAMVRWSAIRRDWASMLPTDSVELAKRSAAVKEYLTQHPNSPLEAVVTDYGALLERVSSVVSRDGAQRKALTALVSAPLISQVKAVSMQNGDTYYMNDTADITDGEVRTLDVLMSADTTRTRRMMKPRAQFAGTPQPAAQVGWARQAGERIRTVTPASADRLMLDLTQDLMSTRDMDPLLRAIIVQRLLQMSLEQLGQPAPELESYLSQLTEFNPDQYPWMNPEHLPVKGAREGAARLLQQIPSLRSIVDRAVQRREAVLKAADWTAVGPVAAVREGSGWKVQLPAVVKDGTRAVSVIGSGGAGSKPELIEVGVVKAGRLEFGSQMDRLPEGSALFLVSEQR